MYLCIYLSIYPSIYLSIHTIYPIYPIWKFKTKLFCETSSIFELDNVKKRSNSAMRPQFLNLTMSSEAPLRDFLQKARAACQCVLQYFQSMCLKYCACHEKSEARSYEVLHLSRKIILAKLKIPYSKMQPFSGNLRPDLLTSLLTDHVSCILFNVPCMPKFLKLLRDLQILLTFTRVQNPLHLRHKTTVQRPKAAQTCGVCSIFTSKRASRQNAVHFLNIAILKSAPALRCF